MPVQVGYVGRRRGVLGELEVLEVGVVNVQVREAGLGQQGGVGGGGVYVCGCFGGKTPRLPRCIATALLLLPPVW